MDNEALILDLLKSLDKKYGELEKIVAAIDKSLVGHDRCEEYRRDGIAHCRAVNAKFNTRLSRVEEICFGYEAVKEKSESELEEAGCRLECFDSRIRKLEDKSRLVDLTWDTVKGNTVLKAAATGLALSVTLPAIGRWNEGVAQYGLHSMLIGAGLFVGGLVLLWAFMNRAATKRFFKL